MQPLLFCQAKVDKSGQRELNLPISLVSSDSNFLGDLKMSAQNERTSAKIYQFPVRGRFANAERISAGRERATDRLNRQRLVSR